MRIGLKTAFMLFAILALGGALVHARLVNSEQDKQHQKEMEELVSVYADSLLEIKTDHGVVTEKYLTSVDDLGSAIKDNDRLRERVHEAEERLDVKVRQVEEMTIKILELELEGQGTVVLDTTGTDEGFVEIVEDTAGVYIKGLVYWPSGRHTLLVKRAPINFIITMQATDSGALVKKSVEFPDQPWISVDKWDAVVLSAEPKKKSFLAGLLPDFRDFKLLAGVSFGTSVGGDLGVSLGDTHAFINLNTDESAIHLARSFSLW
jgi:hypothetical protein